MYLKIIKPILDFIISLILLIISLPLMIITVIITYIDLGLPIYNKIRMREGKNRKPFLMYKIRTKKDDGSYSKISRFIDRYRFNELPQLFNVLKGDMSLVGPRPFIPGEKLPEGEVSNKRYLLKPGITGLAQVNGGRSISHKDKLKYDVIYYDNISFVTDVKIIFKTIIILFKDKIEKK